MGQGYDRAKYDLNRDGGLRVDNLREDGHEKDCGLWVECVGDEADSESREVG